MIQPVGETAGKVWRYLNENRKASLNQLKRGVGADSNLILQAIGWLWHRILVAHPQGGNKPDDCLFSRVEKLRSHPGKLPP